VYPEPNKFRSLEDLQNGAILIVDKPLQWTSFDVVNKIRGTIRRTFNIKKIKVGHAGTLDPLATGVLVVCTGKMTKQIQFLTAEDKSYEATVELGKTTPSYDLETAFEGEFPTDHISEEAVHKALEKFLGTTEQMPPIYSAKKVDGTTAYKAARQGQDIKLNPVNITISKLEILDMELPEITFSVTCSKGTYIRSLAHDIGKSLESGAYLKALRRTGSGSFTIDKAKSVEELVSDISNQGVENDT
jgi:tRNA pseudouridine55 synthase